MVSLILSMERLVEVSDQEVRIDFILGSKCRANVRLRSLSATTPVAFKVQTSSPQKFLVNPPSGLIPPLSSATFQVILKPQSQLPHTFPRSPSDRFLVKTALAPQLSPNSPESTHPDFINSWFNSRTTTLENPPHHDLKLKVAFVGPFLLRHAVAAGDSDAVRNIIKRQRNMLSELARHDAESILRVASELGNNSEPMVDLLIEGGLVCSVTETRWESKGWTGLHVAAAFDRTEEVLRLVKIGGEPLDCRDKEGWTPLHLAASRGNERCAKVLVSAGGDVNARSKDGRNALYRAAANGDRRMVELLMELGADPTVSSADRGRSALDVARDKGYEKVVEILERGEQVLNAARRGETDQLESLLDQDASVRFHDQYGLTALHVAAIKGHKDSVMLLVEFGSELELGDSDGHTPLHLAVQGGHVETVQVLVNRGANVNAQNNKGATPLYLARAMGYDDVTQLLVDRGAYSALPSTSTSSFSSLL